MNKTLPHSRCHHWRLIYLVLFCCISGKTAAEAVFSLPKNYLTAQELGIIVNDADPLSLAIGEYYAKARDIPAENIIHIRFKPGYHNLPPDNFQRIKAQVDGSTPEHVQAFALTWTKPYRVACMSITSAFTFGFDQSLCAKKTCDLTYNSPYYDHPTTSPFDTLGIRPSMMLAASSLEQAKALIDRGLGADNTRPDGTAFLVSTKNRARNVRHVFYPGIARAFRDWTRIEIASVPEGIREKDNILFYFTGIAHVPYLDTLHFRPGAMADHLTSSGGVMPEGRQMSVIRWLEAGATGSYGTVKEPCNHLQKFPHPGIAIERYLRGETMIEAYWKSVKQPIEGVFVGEPLARPFGGYRLSTSNGITTLHTRSLKPGVYRIRYSPNPAGPYVDQVQKINVRRDTMALQFSALADGYYQITPVNESLSSIPVGTKTREVTNTSR